MKKKYIATFAVVGLAIMAMGGLPGLDDEGNPLTPATSIGAIDGSQTDIANLGDLIAPGYQAVSNAAVSAIDASYISPTNSEFVTAVTNCPVLVNPDDASELGEYGTYGTIGAAIMGLLAAVAALKKKIAYGIKSLFSATDSLNREQSALTVTWKDTVTYDNRAAADSIFFKPSVFGMPNGAYISSCTITTTDTGSYLSSNPICIKLVDVSSSAILAVSNLVVADASNTEYTFYLNSRVALADNTKQYAFKFFNDVGQDATLTLIGLRLKVMSGATDLYFGASHQTWRPAITVNWSNETVKSAIEGKMGPYDFADANVSSTLTDSAYPVRLAPFTNNRFNVATPSTSSPYSISVDPVASAYGSDKMRDLWFFVDCTNLTETAIPTLQWDANVFKPTGGNNDQLSLAPEKPNVFMLSEYERGKFLVAREIFETTPDDTKANSTALAPDFSSSATYEVGDVVMHGGLRYKCSTAVSTAGEWNAANWTLESVQTALGNITPGPDNTKANSTALAPNWSNASVSYQVSQYITYNGNAYECMAAYTTDAQSPTPDNDIYDDTVTPATGHWKLTDMTTPDATLDITSQGSLRVVSAGGQILWQQGYNLQTTSSVMPANEAVNRYDFAANATANVSLTLPTPPTDKVGDFVLDVTNPALDTTTFTQSAFSDAATYAVGDEVIYDSKIWRCVTAVSTAGAWTGTTNWEEAWPYFSIAGLSSTLEIIVPEGENLSEILTFAPGTRCELYFTLTSFAVNSKPTWKVVRQDVELYTGDAS